jgi:NAD(P)-dependent dehydrogenase (short-subunit alcohol dehydrogenase family)
MSNSCSGKRVLVTAAGAGIGKGIASAFVEAGAQVHICDIDEERLVACASELPGVSASLVDVSDPEQVDRLFSDAVEALGGLDLLVNNAGIAGPTGPTEDLEPADWDRTIQVNLNSQFYCARRAIPLLKEAGGGLIVNISSSAGLFGYPLRSPYAASKWAIIGLTKTLAMELGEFGIRVNAICSGPVEGPRIDNVIRSRAEEEGVTFETMRDRYLRHNSLHTFFTPQDIANMVLFLCSDAGRKISGQALAIDGNTETLRI